MSLYPWLLDQVLLPVHNRLRGRHYSDYRRRLEQSQWWSRAQLLDQQWRDLAPLLDFAFSSVPYYREKYAAAGFRRQDIQSLADYARLPMLGRDEIRLHLDTLHAPNANGLRPHSTGGSSGSPTRFFITLDSYDWRTAASDRAYSWSGCAHGELALYLWGAPIGTPSPWHRRKTALHNAIERLWIVSSFNQTPELWRRVHAEACLRRPPLLVGYVSSLCAFGRFLRQERLSPPPLRAIISAAEPLPETTRRQLEADLQAPVFNTYGSREFMSIAAECSIHAGLHVHTENILVETARPAADGPSDILVTDLHNYGTPFLRYQIGDVGTLDDTPCPCGRGLPRIHSIDGRTLDVLRRPDGRIVPGEVFPHLMKEFPEVREFQAQQLSLDHIVLSLVLDQPLSPAHRQLIDSELLKFFGPDLRVEIRPVDSIDRLASGKRRVTIGLPPA
jgi:phenylacetate-CoA ligase